MHTTTHATEYLNSLLRGELAAIETYQLALEMVGDDPGGAEIQRLHQEHVQAANTLRQHIRQFGGEPDQTSGTWGTFAQAVEGTAKLFGNTAAVVALKEGEEQGVRDYENALQEEDLPAECKSLISSALLPQTRGHIPALDRVMNLQS